eukprot:TRINITY_DN9651_c0_g1_i2.p1 TRINITY_DN9651_c0_g1~~TRINITY_DN9651_c0_g1_i2.p1  ORF type:complete len:100 (+),score=8.06 TRINITY_DN9651_c0_g1_i2:210-509(+)
MTMSSNRLVGDLNCQHKKTFGLVGSSFSVQNPRCRRSINLCYVSLVEPTETGSNRKHHGCALLAVLPPPSTFDWLPPESPLAPQVPLSLIHISEPTRPY